MLDQKPPMTWGTVSGPTRYGLPAGQIVISASVIPFVVNVSMVVPVWFHTSWTRLRWVAQKPCVRVVPAPLLTNVHVTVAPAASAVIVPVLMVASDPALVPPAPATVTSQPTS